MAEIRLSETFDKLRPVERLDILFLLALQRFQVVQTVVSNGTNEVGFGVLDRENIEVSLYCLFVLKPCFTG